VSYPNVQECIRQVEGGENSSVYSLINLFSGGALLQLSIFALGIMPYITPASSCSCSRWSSRGSSS
jgi:preprotein translocase subunit SecY